MKSDKPDNRPPWAQQVGETAESFAVFVVYRDLGPARTLAEAQRLKGKPQKGRKRTKRKRGASGCIKRWSRRWKWPDRALAWDAMLEAEQTAVVVAAIRKEGQKWAARWEECREKAWLRLEALDEPLDQLVARPLMSVQTTKRAVANPKTEYDAREVISVINPALDMMRAGQFHTQLAQLCFGDLKLTETGPDGSTENLTGEVVAEEARMQSDKPDNRSPWAQQLGETAESFAALVVYRDLGPARNLAEAQRLMAKLQKGRKRATGKRDVSGCMKRWSRRWKWPDRALAWDAMLDGERTAAVVAAIHKEGQKWAARWEEFREKAWLRSEALGETLDQLVARPLMSVQTTKRAVANPKTEYDAREVISLINPALDMMRAGHFHTQLVQLCFGDLKTNRDWTRWFDGKFDGEVVAGEARIVNRPRGTATEDL